MPSPAKIIEELVRIHRMTEEEIASDLNRRGIPVTQATINRIKTGAHKSTRFEIGMGLTQLHERASRNRSRKSNRSEISQPV